MKTSLPTTNNEIVATLVSIVDKIVSMEDDIKVCKDAIVAHADEARISNKTMNDIIHEMQFSVTGLENNMALMKVTLQHLSEFSSSIVIIGNFIATVSKVMFWGVSIGGGVLGILKVLGKI